MRARNKIILWIICALAVVLGAFYVSFIWGFIVFAIVIILTFMMLESKSGTYEKKIIDYIDKYVRTHLLLVSVVITIIGIALLTPTFSIIVHTYREGMYWHQWQNEIARNFPNFQIPILLIGILCLIVGPILINQQAEFKEFTKKHKSAIGIIIGIALTNSGAIFLILNTHAIIGILLLMLGFTLYTFCTFRYHAERGHTS